MKKFAMFVCLFSLTIFLSTNVYAYNQNSGKVKGPEALADNKYHDSPVYALSSAFAPLTGEEVGVIFSSPGWLRNGVCVPSNNRELLIYLMEEDQWPNEDDKVKKYVGTFEGLQLKEIDYINFADPSSNGNIEAYGDKQGEFYLTQYMSQVSGDKTTTNGELYYFDIRVN